LTPSTILSVTPLVTTPVLVTRSLSESTLMSPSLSMVFEKRGGREEEEKIEQGNKKVE